MNKNITPIILLILAIGIYFTFTKNKFDDIKTQQVLNSSYQEALNNSEKLIKLREKVTRDYNDISAENRKNLEKMLPNYIDNVRLIIDVNGVGARHGLFLKNIKTDASSQVASVPNAANNTNSLIANTKTATDGYETVTLSFSVTTDYQTFIDLLKDLEASMRIIDISKITLTAGDTKNYEYGVELKTYWIKQ